MHLHGPTQELVSARGGLVHAKGAKEVDRERGVLVLQAHSALELADVIARNTRRSYSRPKQLRAFMSLMII